MTFGEKITYCRKQKKLSQAELGKLSGINGDIIGKYERDEMRPSIEAAKKIADALDVTIDYLAGGANTKSLDKKTLQRLDDIDKLPDDLKDKVFFFLDMTIRDYKAKAAYAH